MTQSCRQTGLWTRGSGTVVLTGGFRERKNGAEVGDLQTQGEKSSACIPALTRHSPTILTVRSPGHGS